MYRTLLLLSVVAAQCANPIVRREWRQLNAEEKRRFLNAVQRLHDRPAGGADPSTWNYAQFAQVHWDFQQANHDRPPFLPWHREYIHQYEVALRSIDSAVSLPYWDWTIDSQNPAGSDVLAPQNFGLDGAPRTHCLETGVAAGWPSIANPNGCLKRCNQFGSMYPPEAVAAIISRATEFQQFATSVENGPHGVVHIQVAGQCGDFGTMASANDPIFFLHHAMVDKIWWRWQTGCSDFLNKYQGSLSTSMPPFAANIGQVMSTTGGGGSSLCYSYSQSDGDVPLNLNCPSSRTATTSTGTAAPSPTTNPFEFWLERSIQNLVPGSESLRVQNLSHVGLVSSSLNRRDLGYLRDAKDHMVLQNVVVPVGYPTALPTVTGELKATATVTATMDGAYPTATPTIIEYVWNTNYTVHAPPAQNFTDLVHLRYPTPLKSDFIQMMRLNENEVRNVENFVKMVVDKYNNQDGYVSPAALQNYHQHNKLGRWKPKCHPKNQ
jgi:tyrosinase